MRQDLVHKVGLPKGTLAFQAFPRIDYADAYRAMLPAGCRQDIDSITRSLFSSPPAWVRALVVLRDRAVGLLGLKTTNINNLKIEDIKIRQGSSLGIFHIFQRTETEVLLGEDDRHLDFRVSVLRQTEGAESWVIVSTVVRFNGLLGRAYFAFIKPFHRVIVSSMMRRGIRLLSSGAGRQDTAESSFPGSQE